MVLSHAPIVRPLTRLALGVFDAVAPKVNADDACGEATAVGSEAGWDVADTFAEIHLNAGCLEKLLHHALGLLARTISEMRPFVCP